MSSLTDLLQEKGKISEQLQLLNRNVEDLSVDQLKNIITMRERLKEIVYTIDNMKSGIAGRIDTIEFLMFEFMQNLDAELSRIRNNLVVNDNKNIENVMDWLDNLEKMLKEVAQYEKEAEDMHTCQKVEIGFKNRGCKLVDTPVHIEKNCDCNMQDSSKELKNGKVKLAEAKLLNPAVKIKYKPAVTNLIELNKSIQVSDSDMYEAGEISKDVFGITIDNYLPGENDIIKIRDIIRSKNKLQYDNQVKGNPKLEAAKNSMNKANIPIECLNNGDVKNSSTIKNSNALMETASQVKEETNQQNKKIMESADAEVAVAAAQSEMTLPGIVLSPAKDSSTRDRRKTSKTKGKANSKKRSTNKK